MLSARRMFCRVHMFRIKFSAVCFGVVVKVFEATGNRFEGQFGQMKICQQIGMHRRVLIAIEAVKVVRGLNGRRACNDRFEVAKITLL